MIAATTTTKAPVGPPIWIFEPPRAETEEAADDGRVDARLRGDARGDAEGHRQRQRDEAYGDAGNQVVKKVVAAIGAKRLDESRPELPQALRL